MFKASTWVVSSSEAHVVRIASSRDVLTLEQKTSVAEGVEELRARFERSVSDGTFDPPCGRANSLIRDASGEYRSEYMRGAFTAFCATARSVLNIVALDEQMALDIARRIEYVSRRTI